MKIIPLPSETQLKLGRNVKIVMDYTDFNGTGVTNAGNTGFTAAFTSGTAQAIDPPNLQAGQVGTYLPIVIGATTLKNLAGMEVLDVLIDVVTAFTSTGGGSMSALTISVGDTGSGTRFLSAIDLTTAAYTESTTAKYIEPSAWNLTTTVTITGVAMSTLNAGQIEIYANLRPIPDLLLVK